MSSEVIHVGQGIAKDCIVGDRLMDRYIVFNGLEKPRRIDKNLDVTIVDFGRPTIVSVNSVATAGDLEINKWYSYKAVYGSTKYTRPVAVLDDTGNSTRGNPSVVSSKMAASDNSSMSIIILGSSNAAITHIFLYRSTGASTQAEAEAGPFYYVGQATNPAVTTTIVDGLAEASAGEAVETDNYPPNAYRYAVSAFGYIFAGGNMQLGSLYSVTATNGSPTITANSAAFFDGIVGWTFKPVADSSDGVDGMGTYYADYTNSLNLSLVNASGVTMNYGGVTGSGKLFSLYLPGNVLRWCKYGEPEAWPLTNAVTFEGDIMGIGVVPNSSILLVFTDSPSIWAFDLTLVGTAAFKTTKRLVSSLHTTTSHYSICPVGLRLRAIDMSHKCIIETDGVSVVDITSSVVPKIFNHLSADINSMRNWHCAYDPGTNLFGAFVQFVNGHRMVDFCIGQNVVTRNWFFNLEKDLLCTGVYIDPGTGEKMILGGTQGLPLGAGGAVWGRIWAKGTYDDWFPGGLRSGTIVSATTTTITVDNSTENLFTTSGGLSGRWVLITDADGESPQLAYIYSNTANIITISTVINSITSSQLTPVPAAGYKFYIGVIEMRWGPKYFDFGDPDNNKVVLEVLLSMMNYNPDDLPFIRVHRGLEVGFTYHRDLIESTYRDADEKNENLYSRYESHVEECPRWGLSIVDRSYDDTELSTITIVFRRVGGKNERQ